MQQVVVFTGRNECRLEIVVKTFKPEKIWLKVQDEKQAYTVFTERFAEVDGEYVFSVRMPLCGWNAIVFVWNDRSPLDVNDNSFHIVSIKKKELEKRMDYVDTRNPFIASFMKFGIKQFCYNAGILETDRTYSNGIFRIDYYPVLRDEDGNEVSTPCRISADEDKIMQVSQKFFKDATVPGRAALMCHELAHGFINKNSSDEVEADLNGLSIYLGMGFPRIEAHYVFLDTFYGERSNEPMITPTEENQKRYEIIKQFIDEFEKENVSIYEY